MLLGLANAEGQDRKFLFTVVVGFDTAYEVLVCH
jgi:hypothetical protein